MSFLKQNLLLAIALAAIFLRLLDSYKNPNFIYSVTGYTSGDVLFCTLIFMIAVRFYSKQLFNKKTALGLGIMGSALTLGSLIAAFINYSVHENFIFGATQLNIDKLYMLGMFMASLSILSLSNAFFKKNYPWFLCVLGVSLLLLYYLYGFFPLDTRHQLAKEDGFIENMQFLVLLFSGVVALHVSTRIFSKNKLLSVVFLLTACVLIFVAGDEISWGQRILGISSPEYFLQNNAQEEITVHNHVSVHGTIPLLYVFAGLYGSSMWVVTKLFAQYFKKHKTFLILVPGWFLAPYFFAGFFYNFYTQLGDHHIGDWSEPTELMLYLGVFFYLLVLYKTQAWKRN